MAIINCPECSKEISDKAKMCPHCGYENPINIYEDGEYCPSCLKSGYKPKEGFDKCPFCQIEMKFSVRGTFDDIFNYGETHPELKQAPEFSEEAYQKRINYVPYEYSSSHSAKCPTCQSTNLSKITATKRAVKTGLFGIFGAIDDAGKTYKCNNCGSKF